MENSDWYDHVVAGIQYLKTAINGQSRPNVFTNELTFNLITLALEKLLIGLSLHHGKMPQHHRLESLVLAVAEMEPIDAKLIKSIKDIESYQDLCSLEASSCPIPNDMEIQTMLKIGKEVERFVKHRIERRNAELLQNRCTRTYYKKVLVKQ